MTISVVHTIPWVGHGGVERRRVVLARKLGPDFVQHVICLGARDPARSDLLRAGCNLIELQEDEMQSRISAPSIIRAIQCVRRINPDIVHGAVFEGMTLAVAAGLASGARVVIEETSHPDRRSRNAERLQWAYAQASDRVLAVSSEVGEYLANRVGVPHRKLQVVPNGIDAPQRPADDALRAERYRLGLQDADVIGSIGRMVDDVKRFSMLIDALRIIRRERPRAKLLLVGDGRDLGALKHRAATVGLADDVVFAGYREDVGTMLALMDVFALASRTESFALVVAEAMMAGVPVVAAKVGGVPGVVGDAGVLVETPTPLEFATQLSALLGSGDSRRFGEAGRLRATKLFGADRYVDEIRNVYQDVLASR